MSATCAELLVTLLERQGVRLVAGLPGGTVLPIYDALAQSTQIRHLLVRHEQAAGFVAQGYARATGRVGVCLASSGPGATNLLTAVADAGRDSIPLLAITGQVPRPLIGTDAFQEVDTCALARVVTKYSALVRHADELPDILETAFFEALSGRPGPVWIDIPKDVQTELVSDACVAPKALPSDGPQLPADTALMAVVEAMGKAKRPMLYLGGGLVHAKAAQLARTLAERQDIPSVMTLMALGTLPKGHPLSLGMLGMHGSRASHAALREADLLVALGARFDDRATGRLADFCPHAKVVHVDIDARELGKLRRPDIAIAGDLGVVLTALLARLGSCERPLWRARIAALRAAYPDDGSRTAPRALLEDIARAAPPQAIVVSDVGQHQMWVAQHYPLAGARHWLTSGGLGTMGFALPTAIGAAQARPEAPVICFTGDGGLLMNIQELATLAEIDAHVKVIVLDNQSLGLVAQQQALFYKSPGFCSRFEQPADYVTIARGFGIPAFDTGGAASADFWSEVLTVPGPCLVRVPVDAREQALPIVPPGAAHWEAIGG
ncbi:biosynthetic-type acetolactate synthase large subunit [Acidiferrobacter sp.]|uniref:biosynthetic-type acetolactate synthase large subunit n=1 Tax=Acidiferrobacter sp. TaxID=1872107 RepID=UPI002607F0CD|nr:biosynthetic-type acetolactate synthase large subunit [Acidiferrobacter sp.]